MITVTPLYAALLVLLYLLLSWRVISVRRAQGIGVGDGGDKALAKRIRVQANCAEYAPLGIVCLLVLELTDGYGPRLHALGVMLLAGRVLHAVGMSLTPQNLPMRVAGMVLTLTMLGISAIFLLFDTAWHPRF